jgi:hypothetical protein
MRTLRLGAHSDNGSGVTLTVEDTGGGIDGTVLDQVFEPFFTTRSSGTGLLADVLVVDDEEAIRTSVSEILRAAGYSVVEAEDGQALDSRPQVILMSAFRFEGADKQSVGHKVFSHLLKPVAPRRLLVEVGAAMGGRA